MLNKANFRALLATATAGLTLAEREDLRRLAASTSLRDKMEFENRATLLELAVRTAYATICHLPQLPADPGQVFLNAAVAGYRASLAA